MTEQTAAVVPGDPPLIYQRMGEILAALPAIGKNQRNEEQGFVFRGYDDVLNALNPIMSEHGVFVVPDVIERVACKRTLRGDRTMYEVNLHVRFVFYAEDGSWVAASGWGEGTDMGDKATNKAMTNAFKYVLFQTFAISTQEASETDADRHTPEESVGDNLFCRVCGAEIEGARTDRELMRTHLVDTHDWHRNEDGTVIAPEAWAKLEASQNRAAQAAAGEEPQDTPAAAPSTVGTTPGDKPPADVTPSEDIAWVDELKGADLVATGKSYGVSVSGKVQDIRQRIKDAIVEGVDPTAAAATDDAPAAPTQPALGDADEPAADPAPDAPAEPAGDEDGATSGGDFACPDCDESFPTEAEYFDHWYAAHDDSDNAEDPDAATDTADDPAALIQTVKDRIAGLSGEAARAYGKYRRDAKLPRPDEMTADQCTALIEFLDGLGAATG